MKYKWTYGENDTQKYYETSVGNDYLCVFANKWNPFTWMAIIKGRMIHNKTKNDRQRKVQGLQKGCGLHLLRSDYILCSNSPEYMMKKAEWCYGHNVIEVGE